MDFYNEWIIRRRLSLKDHVIISLTTLVSILLIFMIYIQLCYAIEIMFVPLEWAAVIYFGYRIIKTRFVEFEYSVTNSILDVDKITDRRRRKRIASIDVRNFEYFAPMKKEHERAFDDPSITKRIDASSNTMSDRVYFAIFYSGEKTCMVFEPTDKMIENFERYIPRVLNHSR